MQLADRNCGKIGYSMPTWDIAPGTKVVRAELHRRFGGRRQGGIGPSAQTPNVLIFSDPASGEQHGYFDGWKDDGYFHYTGEGQLGDQEMKAGNRAIRDHAVDGRNLRLFYGARGEVTYAGEFHYVDNYEDDAPETGGGPLRKVIVFRLRDLGAAPLRPVGSTSSLGHAPSATATTSEVSVEAQNTESSVLHPGRPPSTAERREAKLVERFTNRATAAGCSVSRLRIVPAGEARPIFSDVLLDGGRWLIEAKGTTTRECVRMAIGQLVDYGRFAPRAERAILLPAKPRQDLSDLAAVAEVTVIWEVDDGGFATVLGDFFK